MTFEEVIVKALERFDERLTGLEEGQSFILKILGEYKENIIGKGKE